MTGVWLHVRARGGHRFALGLVIVALLGWAGAQWLATRPFFDGPGARVPVVALTPLLAALLLGPTLAGADEQLERGTPVRWRFLRLAHLAAASGLIALVLGLIGLRSPEQYGAYALMRNTLGCVGLVAGAAVVLGARFAWAPAFTYVCAVYAAGPRRDGSPQEAWAWPIEPSSARASWAVALIVALAGSAAYILAGPKEHHHVRDTP